MLWVDIEANYPVGMSLSSVTIKLHAKPLSQRRGRMGITMTVAIHKRYGE